ncbi:nuclear transport factor 2 family protein [Algisphaera agarilytica]|uniref:Putative SnoaL-like aldol condensation-catalyzing enzyme n=1 Tax=Algisphaera agarilytica TaxID=1385975 RepID=A0A7X0H975_9BACT|nr:putative SnoaL-like aldol condensation-catalyzing enzyme [Algisphaera agarilytica]
MKTALSLVLTASALSACGAPQATTPEATMEPTNAQKAVALLNSIETGDTSAVAYINPEQYTQHNLAVADGLAGFGEVLAALPEGSAKVSVQRVLTDGDYVITHTEYDFFGPKVGFDIFRFEDGLIVEHWDNLQELVAETASGRTQIDGPTEVTDLELTEANKALVKGFVADVLMGGSPEKITQYIHPDNYAQHNPAVGDGLAALGAAMKAMAEAGTPMVYEKNHAVFGEGNFVLTVSEGVFLGQPTSFYDLFRIDGGKIVEHWDAIETIPPRDEWKNDNGKFGFPGME